MGETAIQFLERWRQAEATIAAQIRARRPTEATDTAGHLDILVAREMARIDLGVGLVVTQPRGTS